MANKFKANVKVFFSCFVCVCVLLVGCCCCRRLFCTDVYSAAIIPYFEESLKRTSLRFTIQFDKVPERSVMFEVTI